MRKTYAEINLSNLLFNYHSIKKQVGKKVQVMPVVKADAYGHGMIECVKALLKSKQKPEYFAVALLEEALEFRNHFREKILVFGRIGKDHLPEAIKKNITPTIWLKEDLISLNTAAKKLNKKGKFHLEIDTGMTRTGINPEETTEFIKLIKLLKNIELEGVFTHYATSDCENKSFAIEQLNTFKKCVNEIKKLIPEIKYIHTANSGAILDLPDTYFNMVRPGISLYGYYPSDETSESIPLKPVMSLITYPVSIRKIKPYTSVSYGQKYISTSETTIITLPVGYADGYSRALTGKGRVIFKDNLYPVAGRVCMDYIMADIGNEKISYNDKIIIMGKSRTKNFDAMDISRLINTIPYEVCTSVSKRVKRVYKN